MYATSESGSTNEGERGMEFSGRGDNDRNRKEYAVGLVTRKGTTVSPLNLRSASKVPRVPW